MPAVFGLPQQAKGEFNDLRVGVLHLASLIDSVVRQADDSCGGDSGGGGLIPAKSRVQILKAKALSKAAGVVAVAADSSSTGGPATGVGAAPVVAPAATIAATSVPEGELFSM